MLGISRLRPLDGGVENAELCRIVTFFERESLQKSLQFWRAFVRRPFAVFATTPSVF